MANNGVFEVLITRNPDKIPENDNQWDHDFMKNVHSIISNPVFARCSSRLTIFISEVGAHREIYTPEKIHCLQEYTKIPENIPIYAVIRLITLNTAVEYPSEYIEKISKNYPNYDFYICFIPDGGKDFAFKLVSGDYIDMGEISPKFERDRFLDLVADRDK